MVLSLDFTIATSNPDTQDYVSPAPMIHMYVGYTLECFTEQLSNAALFLHMLTCACKCVKSA